MKLIYPAILAGAALIGLAAFAPSLAQKQPAVHHMTVWLPGGGMETISYTGSVAPKVIVNPVPFAFGWPGMASFGFAPSFAAMDLLSDDMDREMGAFLRQVETLTRLPTSPDLTNAGLQTLPAGGASYSLISETTVNGSCTRMVQVTRQANSDKPQVISRMSGNCADGTPRTLAPETTGATPQAISAPMSRAAPAVSRTAL
jgi:hypothetical protein